LLDIHILKSRPSGPVFDRCLNSAIETGANVRVIENTGKDILTGRIQGYMETDSKFVSFIDDDDFSLLKPDVANSLMDLNEKALFTNGIKMRNGEWAYKVLPKYTKWTLDLEKQQEIRPHATIIYQGNFAKELLTDSISLIEKKNWDVNTIDYVMRAMVSTTIGWHYVNVSTYQWNIGADSHHINQGMFLFPELRKYFFG
jgi:hypothetical protein